MKNSTLDEIFKDFNDIFSDFDLVFNKKIVTINTPIDKQTSNHYEFEKLENEYQINLPVAGFNKTNTKIELKDDEKYISVECKKDNKELSYLILVPELLDTSTLTAKVEDGLLTMNAKIKSKSKGNRIISIS